MRFSRPVAGTITARFTQKRPIGAQEKTHIHGAVDIAGAVGQPIYAPESGSVFGYIGIRHQSRQWWPQYIEIHGQGFPFLNYFYDTFGGVIVLRSHNDNPAVTVRTHVLTHSYANQIINHEPFADFTAHWLEERADARFPVFAVYTDEIIVEKGDVIGHVGNAGFSTGAHVHWEIHKGYAWQRHDERLNPAEYL